MPTAASNTYSANRIVPVYDPDEAPRINVKLAASQVIAKGTVMGETTATPGLFKPYASGNADGTQIPKGILEYDCATDAAANITFGGVAGAGTFGETHLVAPLYIGGYFKTTELTGLDANAIAVLQAAFVSGVLADGVIQFG
jgi:hypothetical protein